MRNSQIVLLGLLWFWGMPVFSQITPGALPTIEESCQIGRQAAMADLASGELGYFFYGHSNPRFDYYVRLMVEEYGLTVKGRGCLIAEEGMCYNDVMREAIKSQYGEAAFECINLKLDSLEHLGLANRAAYFPGEEGAFGRYIYRNIDSSLLVTDDAEAPKIIITFSIGVNGEATNIAVRREEEVADLYPRYLEEIYRLLGEMPAWVPGQARGAYKTYLTGIRVIFSYAKRKEVLE